MLTDGKHFVGAGRVKNDSALTESMGVSFRCGTPLGALFLLWPPGPKTACCLLTNHMEMPPCEKIFSIFFPPSVLKTAFLTALARGNAIRKFFAVWG